LTAIVTVRTGTAAQLHSTVEPRSDVTTVMLCVPDRRALVLGSRQHGDLVALDRIDERGIELVHRRSGGGIVMVDPADAVWIDVIVPRRDVRFGGDIRSDMMHMGEVWRQALLAVGADPAVMTLHGPHMTNDAWGDLICFAGSGPGEVMVDGHKLVGISQRRTNEWLRFQCQMHLVDPTDLILDLLRERPQGEPQRPALVSSVFDRPLSGVDLAEAIADVIG
jgi:lipoate-protein ligase A